MAEKTTTRVQSLTDKIAAARSELNAALDKTGERGDEQIYSEGAQWTLRQLVIHLAWADAGHNNMLYHYAEDKPFIPAGYDVDHANKSAVEKRDQMTMAQARASLTQSRQELLTWLETIDDAILQKTGRHPMREDATLTQTLLMMAAHEQGHTADILAHMAAD